MRVVFSPVAERDLEDIADYIAENNPRRALSFVRDIRERCKKLATSPRSARPFPALGAASRILPYGSYVILYRIVEDEVSIERVLHGARDILRLISEDE
jgi:toxin ParE1/3/4